MTCSIRMMVDARRRDAPNGLHHVVDFLRAKAADRLIHQEKLRPCRKGAREHEKLAVQHGKLARDHRILAGQPTASSAAVV